MIKEKLIDSNILTRNDDFNLDILKEMLNKKFNEINFSDAKEDVIAFIKDKESLNLWSSEFFVEISKSIKVQTYM